MVTALARAVLAFHAVKLAGLAANLVMFPVLRPQGAARPGAGRPEVSVLVPARDEACRCPLC